MTWNMGIILYNGDSFTYGDELEGSRNTKGEDYHHHHTYAYKLSHMLGKKYVNLAANGSSNTKIFRTTLDFLQKDDRDIDLLVITWSSWGRFEICEPFRLESDKNINIPQECNMNQVIPFHGSSSLRWEIGDDAHPERTDILRLYTEKVLSMHTQIVHGMMYMKHIQWLCDQLGIKVIQGVIHGDLYKNILSTMKSDGYSDYKSEMIDSLDYLRPECKLGLGHYTDIFSLSYNVGTVKPMGHADEVAHTEYANMMYQISKRRRWF